MGRNKIGLFNATDLVDNNPGCRATMNYLRRQLKGDIIFEFPLGFGYHYFYRNFFFKSRLSFKRGYLKVQSNQDFQDKLKKIDLIIINCEGTIHSDSLGAKALLSYAKLAKKLRKKVFLVNGSYYNLSNELLEIIKVCDKVLVREKASEQYLIGENIKAELVLDCAFLIQTNLLNRERSNVLYTPGVTFNYRKDRVELLKAHYNSLRRNYINPTFLIIEDSEIDLSVLWGKLGGEVIDSRNIEVNKVIELINSFELVVSGRYHILLFSIMCGLKTLPLKSNTDKIIGLYSNFGVNISALKNTIKGDSIELESIIHFDININQVRKDIIEAYEKLVY